MPRRFGLRGVVQSPQDRLHREVDRLRKQIRQLETNSRGEALRDRRAANRARLTPFAGDPAGVISRIIRRATEPPDSPHRAVFRKDGSGWAIAYDGTGIRLGDLRGLGHIALLLGNPNQQYHCGQLCVALGDLDPNLIARGFDMAELEQDGLTLAPGEAEKTRKRVSRRIVRAIEKVRENHPALGAHLSQSIKKGTYCWYAPMTDIDWEIDA